MNTQELAQKQIESALINVEKALDEQIAQANEEMERIQDDEDEYERLRRKRLQELKEEHEKKQKWKFLGHGTLQEIHDSNQFFTAVKQSERVIAFFTNGNKWCSYLEGHLQKISQRHPETKFMKINAEKVQDLSSHLQILMLPTMTLIKNGETDHSIIGLDEVGGQEMTTISIARALASNGMIDLQRSS